MNAGIIYGFSIPIVILGAVGVTGSIILYVRTRQFMLRYSFLCLAGVFNFIRRATFLAAINDDTLDPESSRHMVEGNMARLFLFKMFTPLLYCVFFEICHSLIFMSYTTTLSSTESNQARGDVTLSIAATKSIIYYHITKLPGIILAYAWTIVLIVVNIAYCSVFANNFPIYTEEQVLNLQSMSRFTSYGIWAYFIFASLQLVLGWNEVRPHIISLLAYLLPVCISTVGMTAVAALPIMTPSDEVTSQTVSFVLVELVGLFGLFFALFASTQYWMTVKQHPTSTEAPNEQYDSVVNTTVDSKFGGVTRTKYLEDSSQKSITSTTGSSSTKQLDQRSFYSKNRV